LIGVFRESEKTTQNFSQKLKKFTPNFFLADLRNNYNFTWPQPINVPAISTMAVGNITETTATFGGNISNDSGSSVFERGVRWSTDEFYEQANRKIDDSTGNGSFTISITGLTPNTTY